MAPSQVCSLTAVRGFQTLVLMTRGFLVVSSIWMRAGSFVSRTTNIRLLILRLTMINAGGLTRRTGFALDPFALPSLCRERVFGTSCCTSLISSVTAFALPRRETFQ